MRCAVRTVHTHNQGCDGRPGGLRSNAHLEPLLLLRSPESPPDFPPPFARGPGLSLYYQCRDYAPVRSRPTRPRASRLECRVGFAHQESVTSYSMGSAHPTDSPGAALDRKLCPLRIHIRRGRKTGQNCIRGFTMLGCFGALFTRGRSAWRVRTSPPVTDPLR
jgi:hypothetical protein